MKEIDFYPEICNGFSKYLESYLPKNSKIFFSFNKLLPQMIDEIESKAGIQSKSSSVYIPKLKLDILFGIKIPNKIELVYILLEVKYLNQLSLADYSQLIGYLQVAKNIIFGILFLVIKPNSINSLSNDLQEILRTQNLPMEWKMHINKNIRDEYHFKTGISYYVPLNGIDWVNTNDVQGISSFKELADLIST